MLDCLIAFQTVTPAQRIAVEFCEISQVLNDPNRERLASSLVERKTSGNGSQVSSERNGVSAKGESASRSEKWGRGDELLESTVDRVSRGLRFSARSLLTFATDLAVEAGVGEPFDSDRFSDFSLSRSSVCRSNRFGISLVQYERQGLLD